MFNIYGNPHTFRKRYITKEVHSFSGYTEIHWSDGHVDKHIPGIRHSDLKLGEQKMDPGTPWYGYFYNPETNKHEGQWVVSDESGNITFLTDEEKINYVKSYNDGKFKGELPIDKSEQEERD